MITPTNKSFQDIHNPTYHCRNSWNIWEIDLVDFSHSWEKNFRQLSGRRDENEKIPMKQNFIDGSLNKKHFRRHILVLFHSTLQFP